MRRNYKIYYAIAYETPLSGVVRILHIRHWARKPRTTSELEELMEDESYLEVEE